MSPYIFLLRKLDHAGKPTIHSSWIGHRQLPHHIIKHTMPLRQLKDELRKYGYSLQRVA